MTILVVLISVLKYGIDDIKTLLMLSNESRDYIFDNIEWFFFSFSLVLIWYISSIVSSNYS